MLLAAITGCESQRPQLAPPDPVKHSEAIELREGDVLKINFPGAPALNATQQVRRDGKIALALVGELKVVGLTPAAVEQEILKLYDTQLVTKEVTVTVETSSFPVFVTGAAVHPGKIMSDHPITALEAIMEAGGFDYAKANLKKVTIIRNQADSTEQFTLNLKTVLDGKSVKPFYLKPADIIYIPEKFSWF